MILHTNNSYKMFYKNSSFRSRLIDKTSNFKIIIFSKVFIASVKIRTFAYIFVRLGFFNSYKKPNSPLIFCSNLNVKYLKTRGFMS